ncbi:hypothetical protein IFM89_027283 [Coptis chinensis]|uniref:Bifunctional inhibitor/plant lipid transfer protein/seed storage helical domain-containing protein n=1 Tax=Coptis chinensis TaxID=261450 RepID=A0A835H746_9MAGN|nr:hypothetical protein IFM89_027283 [Coptis chinensis]
MINRVPYLNAPIPSLSVLSLTRSLIVAWKKFKMKVSNLAVFFALFLVLSVANVSMAQTCNIYDLQPCLNAFTSGTFPSPLCCTRLKRQRPCLCQYKRNPSLRKYANSRNTRLILSRCGVPYPNC